MIGLVAELEERGLAYERDGSVYYRVSGLPQYGCLSHIDREGMKSGASVDSDEYDRDSIERLRPLEGDEAGRALVGEPVGQGPAGLAHRVLGDGAEAARRASRHPHRRRGPDLPAPRERDRAERGRDRPPVGAPLGARRVPDGGGREDVQEPGQLLHAARPGGAGRRADDVSLRDPEQPLPQAVQLQLRGAARGQGDARPDPRRSGSGWRTRRRPAREGAPAGGHRPRGARRTGARRVLAGAGRRPNTPEALAAMLTLVTDVNSPDDHRPLARDTRDAVLAFLDETDRDLRRLAAHRARRSTPRWRR